MSSGPAVVRPGAGVLGQLSLDALELLDADNRVKAARRHALISPAVLPQVPAVGQHTLDLLLGERLAAMHPFGTRLPDRLDHAIPFEPRLDGADGAQLLEFVERRRS